jgi:hypothetical protein
VQKKGIITLLFILLLIPASIFAQVSSLHTFDFLNLPASARVASLGGINLAVKDNDVNMAFQNPSLLNPTMHNQLAFNMVNYFSDVKYGYVAYGYDLKKFGTYNLGLHYINYGEFQGASVNSDLTGTFRAAEYNLNLGWGQQLNHLETFGLNSKFDSLFSVGINLKTIYSHLEQYSAVGLAADIATTFYHKKSEFTSALVIKNYGTQVKPYRAGNKEPLPFEVQIGISKKLAKAPLRISLTARHLEKYDLTYVDSSKATTDPITNTTVYPSSSTFEKIMMHLVIGTELLLTKNFNIRAGFNYQRRSELELSSRTSIIGFSAGFGLRISKFQLSYGIASYHLAGTSNHFSITSNLSDFWAKKN